LIWKVCVDPAVRPLTSHRNGTTWPSPYDELLPFRLPNCHEHVGEAVAFAHCDNVGSQNVVNAITFAWAVSELSYR
jgi:hypothetical protein